MLLFLSLLQTSANITAKARPGIEVLPLAAIARKVRQANKKVRTCTEQAGLGQQGSLQLTLDPMSSSLQDKVLLIRDQPCPPGSFAEGHPAVPTSSALPRGVGPAVEALSLSLIGLFCSFQQCCVCGERGAAITCAQGGCERSFHLPCAKDGQCVTQFFREHR